MEQVAWLTVLLAILQAGEPPADRPGWHRHEPSEGGYSILLPGEPTRQRQEVTTSSGKVQVRGSLLGTGEVIYAVYQYDNPTIPEAGRDRYLDGIRDGTVAKKNGRLLDEEHIEVEGHPARDLTIEEPAGRQGQAHSWHRIRLILVGDRLYQLLAAAPWATRRAHADDFDAFLRSFKIVPDRPGPPDVEPANEAAKLVRSEAGGFTVLMPGVPAEQTETAGSGGGRITLHMIRADIDDVSYLVSYHDADARSVRDPKALLDGQRDLAVKSHDGHLIADRRIQVRRHPGRDFRAEYRKGDDPRGGVLQGRIFLAGRRVYQVIALAPRAKAGSPMITTFLQSFTTIPRK